MYVWEKSSSTFGGLFQKDEEHIEYLPHKMTPDDAQLVMDFFDIVALGKYNLYL